MMGVVAMLSGEMEMVEASSTYLDCCFELLFSLFESRARYPLFR